MFLTHGLVGGRAPRRETFVMFSAGTEKEPFLLAAGRWPLVRVWGSMSFFRAVRLHSHALIALDSSLHTSLRAPAQA